jgi:ABC-type sugar transport system ATPase subunit
LETIFGAGEPTWTGEIRLDGKPVRFQHPREACDARIAMVTEDRKRLGLFPDLDVAGNVSLCSLRDAVRGGLLSRQREESLVAGPIRDTGVKTPGPHAAITGLSGGNQQKCIISRWLLTKPAILLLDDPTRGIDVGARHEIYLLMNELAARGKALVMVSSELPEVLGMADRILVMHEGRVTGEILNGSDVTQEEIMRLAMA